MIHNIAELAAHLGAYRPDAESVARRLFKDTECGICFYATDTLVSVAGYAEGSDVACPPYELRYPFTTVDFDTAVAEADRDGCALWDADAFAGC